MTPKVETLAQSMAAVGAGYNEQRALINEQIAGLDSMYGAKREALEGTRIKSFNNINTQAAGRGVAFGGIPLEEQANYLADQYLPGLTNLAVQENQERMQYRTNIAQLNAQQNAAALGRIDQQQAALNQWNLQQAQLEARRRESELDRQFQASQAAADRAAQAANSKAQTMTWKDSIVDLMASGAEAGSTWLNDGSTERWIQSTAQRYGIDKNLVAQYAYGQRKTIYNR